MKVKSFVAVLFITAVLSGCVPSIHEFYTSEDVIFDPALVGTWIGENEEQVFEFSTEDSFSYSLIYTDDSISSEFTVHLFLLDDKLLMDLYPEEPEFGNDFYRSCLIRSHNATRVHLDNGILRLDGLDIEWVEDMVEGGLKIDHEIIEDNTILLTADSKDLQVLLSKALEDEDAFAEGDELYKKE